MDGTWHLALWTNYSSPIYLLQQRCHIQRFLGRFCVSILSSITIKIDLNVFLFCLLHLHFSSLLLRVDTENILQELKTKISVLIRAYRTMFEVAQSSYLWLYLVCDITVSGNIAPPVFIPFISFISSSVYCASSCPFIGHSTIHYHHLWNTINHGVCVEGERILDFFHDLRNFGLKIQNIQNGLKLCSFSWEIYN